MNATVPVRSTDSPRTFNDPSLDAVRPSIGVAVPIPQPRTQAVAPSLAARALIQELHDEMRADIPDIKIGWKHLLSPPWKRDRIDRVAVKLDAAIDARLAADRDAHVEADIARIDAAVEAALLRQSKSRRRAA